MKNEDSFLNLQCKVAIITGAATGLGAATAQILAAAGANVLINHMPGQESQAKTVADKCVSNGLSDSLCQAGNITKDEDCKAMVQAALDQWGRVDILINNAGFNKPVEHDDLDGLSAQNFIDLYSVHVIGAYQMIRAAAPAMKSQGKGVVVNVSSGSGETGYGSSVAYSASKGALNTLTRSLGRALAPNIRVNAICPGMVMTPLWDKLQHTEAQRATWLDTVIAEIPLKKEPTAEIIARSILYLASDLSAHLTGQLITADGGTSLGLYQSMFEQK
jgi:3-oxoacyl-[acyl-carrier protein] reductase